VRLARAGVEGLRSVQNQLKLRRRPQPGSRPPPALQNWVVNFFSRPKRVR
jgi:hypothetical protein